MKKTIILITSAVILGFVSMQAQDNKLIYSTNNSAKIADTKQNAALQEDPVNESIDYIEIDLDKLKGISTLSIQYDNKNYLVKEERLQVRDVNNYSWFGTNNDQDGNIILSVLGDDVQGILTKGNDIYRISTLGPEQYAMVKIDQSQYPEEKCDNLEHSADHVTTGSGQAQSANSVYLEDVSDDIVMYDATVPYSCNVRVIVMFTPAANAAVSNIKNTIQLAIDETNQSFINSGVTHRVELAYVEQTSYTEVSTVTDLNRFRANGDGYMDEVHGLRNKYSADVCVIVSDDPSYCGYAAAIGANATNSFCLVDYNCATGYYSFAHEIGHLLGCRHDTYVDNNLSPYAYGHGFVNLPDRWRTIMAYNRRCTDNGTSCTRLQYWSNPTRTYGGDAMGTTLREYNARVWNVNSNTIKAFRQPAFGILLANADISNSLYGDVIARDNIQTNGNMTVPSGSTLRLRASSRINLKQGFRANPGSNFIAGNTNVTNCTAADVKSAPKAESITANITEQFSYKIYPNPSNGILNIDYAMASEESISIELIDFLGKEISVISAKTLQLPGKHTIQFDASVLASGIYFIRFMKNDEIINERIILE